MLGDCISGGEHTRVAQYRETCSKQAQIDRSATVHKRLRRFWPHDFRRLYALMLQLRGWAKHGNVPYAVCWSESLTHLLRRRPRLSQGSAGSTDEPSDDEELEQFTFHSCKRRIKGSKKLEGEVLQSACAFEAFLVVEVFRFRRCQGRACGV